MKVLYLIVISIFCLGINCQSIPNGSQIYKGKPRPDNYGKYKAPGHEDDEDDPIDPNPVVEEKKKTEVIEDKKDNTVDVKDENKNVTTMLEQNVGYNETNINQTA